MLAHRLGHMCTFPSSFQAWALQLLQQCFKEIVIRLQIGVGTAHRLHARYVQWNPSITDTIVKQHFVLYSEVSLTQGLPVYFR